MQDGLPFYGMQLRGAYWRDIGTPDEYRRATEDVVCGRVAIAGARATGVPASATLADDVVIDGAVRVGENVEIANGARIIGPTVIDDGVRVMRDAVLERAIVWSGSTIGARAVVRDTVVGERYVVDDDATLDGAIVANEPSPA